MFEVAKTYEVVTPGSAERGDTEDSGYVYKRAFLTFRELVDEMRGHSEPSEWPVREPSVGDVLLYVPWLTEGESDTDLRTGTERRTSIHFCDGQPASRRRWWFKAMRVAGIKVLPPRDAS